MTTTTIPPQEICKNCRRPVDHHRPWCGEFVTRAEPPKEGDIIDHPVFGSTPLISVYLRQEAIQDGVLVDCTEGDFDELNRNAGVIFDVAMTRAVFERYIEVPESAQAVQDIKGRYWDILIKYREAALKAGDAHELQLEFLSMPNGTDMLDNERDSGFPGHHMVQLKVLSGEGDRGEPILTFMLPSED